jgi:hypothetical protein
MRQLVLHESERLIPQSTCDRIERERRAAPAASHVVA